MASPRAPPDKAGKALQRSRAWATGCGRVTQRSTVAVTELSSQAEPPTKELEVLTRHGHPKRATHPHPHVLGSMPHTFLVWFLGEERVVAVRSPMSRLIMGLYPQHLLAVSSHPHVGCPPAPGIPPPGAPSACVCLLMCLSVLPPACSTPTCCTGLWRPQHPSGTSLGR